VTTPLRRSDLLADRSLNGRAFCEAWTDRVEAWLEDLFDAAVAGADPSGAVALVAVGGQGRRELAPQSDLDLLLLVERPEDGPPVADRLWYPVWDAGLKLGHAVRTVRDTLSLAGEDLETATALLSARWVTGDPGLADELAERARSSWRRKGRRWLEELARAVEARHAQHGEVAFELEPDLKEGRGGLRDVHALSWARDAGAEVAAPVLEDLRGHHDALLEVRIELHRATSRPGDRLLLQEQDAVATALGDADADALMARVAAAGRAIAWASDEAWHEIRMSLDGAGLGRFRRERRLDDGLVLRSGRVDLADDGAADPDAAPPPAPGAVLRVALAAARAGARIGRPTLERLARATPLPEPWPEAARRDFCDLLLCGPAAVPVIEALDQWGLWVSLLPEWAPNRNRPQRNAYHRFTVDRHLLEATAEAAGLAQRVPDPDLLVMAALLHDIGKGYPGDHSEVGEELARAVCTRMGFSDDDVATVVAAVRHHLLLPDVATRRDLDDPATLELVARHAGTPERLALLRALCEADSIATGSSAWSPWKAGLVEQLATRTARVLAGGQVADVVEHAFPTPAQRELLAAGRTRVVADGERVTVVCPDRPGLFFRIAGALALHGLDVTDAAIHTEDGMAVDEFGVRAGGSGVVPWERVTADVERVLAGRLALQARLDERVRSHRRRHRPGLHQLAPAVRFDDDASAAATVVEVVGPDSLGLLYRLTRALAELDLDVRGAKIHTMGVDVVDTFYVVDRDGGRVTDADHQAEVRRALLHALDPTAG
jgi:[protein-PII] uridylyltransferase